MDPKTDCCDLTKTLSVLSEILDMQTLKQANKNWQHLANHLTMSISLPLKIHNRSYKVSNTGALFYNNDVLMTSVAGGR